jgi:hypothetical protein
MTNKDDLETGTFASEGTQNADSAQLSDASSVAEKATTTAAGKKGSKPKPKRKRSDSPSLENCQAKALSGNNSDMEEQLLGFPVEHIKAGEHVKDVSDEEVKKIVETLVSLYGISYRTSLNAICELIRRGGPAKDTPPSYSVEVFCPDSNVSAVIAKRDIDRSVEAICKGRRNLRNLAIKACPSYRSYWFKKTGYNSSLRYVR